MVQPKYSPEEALEKMKLMMKYDLSKTLNENKNIISEQYAGPSAGLTAAGAGVGAAAAGTAAAAGASVAGGATGAAFTVGAALLPVSTSVGAVGAAALGGAVLGGALALGVAPLAYWLITKDTGANKVKKMFEMCSTDGAKIAKLERKMQDTELRSISDDIEDAIINDSFGFQGGTDEEKLFGAFKKLESGTASDFCALVALYNKNSDSGDLFDDLDSDIDAESEWKQIFRPIRNCVEDSLLKLKDEDPKKEDGKNPIRTGSGYKPCSGTYSKGCKSDTIAKVQGCLGLVTDGKFGPKTLTALTAKGFTTFTDADVTKICQSKPTEVEPEISGEEQRINGNDF